MANTHAHAVSIVIILCCEMASCKSDLLCSFQANVVGIKFYPGYHYLKPCVPVHLQREPGNIHDTNAVMAYIESGTKQDTVALGDLEKGVASVIAPMMDCLSGDRYVALVVLFELH